MIATNPQGLETDVTFFMYSGRRFSNSSGSSQLRRSGSYASSATKNGALGWKMSTSLPDFEGKSKPQFDEHAVLIGPKQC